MDGKLLLTWGASRLLLFLGLAVIMKLLLATLAAPEGVRLTLNCPALAKVQTYLGIPFCEANRELDSDWLVSRYPGLHGEVSDLYGLHLQLEQQSDQPVPVELAFQIAGEQGKLSLLGVIEKKGWVNYGDLWKVVQKG